MGMGDPTWVSLLPTPPAEDARTMANKGALAGYELGKTGAMYGALKNTNLHDAASVDAAVSRLVQTGNADVGGALMKLGVTRDVYSRIPGILNSLDKLGQPQPATTATAPDTGGITSGQTGVDVGGHYQDTMTQAAQAASELLSLPPEQRQSRFNQMKQTFMDRGIPEDAIDAVGSDLSDMHLHDLADHYQAHIDYAQNGGAAPQMHPTTSRWSQQYLSTPAYAAGLETLKGIAGIDLTGLTSTAQTLEAPYIAKQAELGSAQGIAQANTAGTNLANTNPATAPPAFKGGVSDGAGGQVMISGGVKGQQAEAGATALGSEAGTHGGRVTYDERGNPIVQPVQGAAPTAAGFQGQVAGATAGATAAATAPYELVPGITDPATGAPLYRTRADVAARNIPSAGATPQQGAVNTASAGQLVADRASSGQLQTALVPLRTAYDTISKGGVTLGPGSETVNRMRSFVLSTLGPGVINPEQVANYDEVHKYLVQIANQRATQFGAGTNEKLAVAASGSPNVDMSNLGAATVLRMNIALARADAAKAAAYGNGAPEGYGQFASNYGRTTDPRAFMLDLLKPNERTALFAQIRKGSDAERTAFAKGLQAAEAAGYFHSSDFRR